MPSGYKKDGSFAGKVFIKGKENPHQFQKGCIPWSKGTKGIVKPNSKSFQKGHPIFVKRKGIYKICPICNKEFYVAQSLKRIKYCSNKCYGKTRIGISPWNKGLIGIFIKEKAMNWQGGKSLEEYGIEFDNSLREQIRFRDKYKCRNCGCSQIENGKQLDIHHIDYNKRNNEFNNLISLCIRCHRKTIGKNRDYWKNYFQEKIKILINQ